MPYPPTEGPVGRLQPGAQLPDVLAVGVASSDRATVGSVDVGSDDDRSPEPDVGELVGSDAGAAVLVLGSAVGEPVGLTVGVGLLVGLGAGLVVGLGDGLGVGLGVGVRVGLGVGWAVGLGAGLLGGIVGVEPFGAGDVTGGGSTVTGGSPGAGTSPKILVAA